MLHLHMNDLPEHVFSSYYDHSNDWMSCCVTIWMKSWRYNTSSLISTTFRVNGDYPYTTRKRLEVATVCGGDLRKRYGMATGKRKDKARLRSPSMLLSSQLCSSSLDESSAPGGCFTQSWSQVLSQLVATRIVVPLFSTRDTRKRTVRWWWIISAYAGYCPSW